MLRDFSQIIDSNLKTLFVVAHSHNKVVSTPDVNTGAVGDIYIGDLAGGKKIFVKFSDGWYYANLAKA